MPFTAGCHPHRGRDGVPVLTYFDTKGYAEPIRLIFSISNINFVDRRIKNPEEFQAKYQKYSPTGLVPILEVDGEVLCESQAILVYAAKRAGLYPENPRDQDKALAILSTLIEMDSGSVIPSSLPREEKFAKMKALRAESAPRLYTRIETLIEPSANGWIVGDRLTFIDIAVQYSVVLTEMFGDADAAANLLQQYPKIARVYNAVSNHPGVQAYNRKAYPSKPKLYYFNAEGVVTPARWMFDIGGVDYEDIRVAMPDWPAMKATIPGGVLPALDLGNDNWLTESPAIAIHAARMAGLVPHKEGDFAHAFSILLTLAPLGPIFRTVRYAPTPEAVAEAKKIAYEQTVPAMYRRLEQVVALRQSKQGYCVGDRLSFADIYVAYACAVAIDGGRGIVPNILNELPCCNKIADLVLNHPTIKAARFRGVVSTPKLSYFDLPGRAEHIRQLLKYGKIDFVDHRLDFATWRSDYKAQSVTGVMPYLDLGEERIYEIIGCLQYVAERTGTMPRTWKGRAQALTIFSVQGNVHQVVLKHYAAADAEGKKALVQELKPEYYKQLDILEKIVAQYQSVEGYCVDHELSYIDFYVAYELSYNRDCGFLPDGWQEKYPALATTYNLVKALETTH